MWQTLLSAHHWPSCLLGQCCSKCGPRPAAPLEGLLDPQDPGPCQPRCAEARVCLSPDSQVAQVHSSLRVQIWWPPSGEDAAVVRTVQAPFNKSLPAPTSPCNWSLRGQVCHPWSWSCPPSPSYPVFLLLDLSPLWRVPLLGKCSCFDFMTVFMPVCVSLYCALSHPC